MTILFTISGFAFIIAVTPTWLLVKSSTLCVGVVFFGLFPIAVNFPEYRLLVSPLKRLLWNIPTHAEWAIKYIQAEGTRVEQHTALSNSQNSANVTSTCTDQHDYGFYKAHHDGVVGRLAISLGSIRFVSNVGHIVHFTMLFNQIQRLEKQDRPVAKKLPSKIVSDSGKDIKLVNKAGEEWVVQNIEQRDEVFSQIVGFSKTTWQVLW